MIERVLIGRLKNITLHDTLHGFRQKRRQHLPLLCVGGGGEGERAMLTQTLGCSLLSKGGLLLLPCARPTKRAGGPRGAGLLEFAVALRLPPPIG